MITLPKPILVLMILAFILVVISPVLLGITGAIYELYHGLQWISFAKRIQWESILAGVLGLFAGLFVIYSTRAQIEAAKAETEITLDQARRHRADDATAVLQLVNDVSERLNLWATERLEMIETLRAHAIQENSNQSAISSWNNALASTYNKLGERCEYVEKLLTSHQTTHFTFEISRALLRVSRAHVRKVREDESLLPWDEPTQEQLHQNTMQILTEARNSSAQARTEINRQIKHINERCGIK